MFICCFKMSLNHWNAVLGCCIEHSQERITYLQTLLSIKEAQQSSTSSPICVYVCLHGSVCVWCVCKSVCMYTHESESAVSRNSSSMINGPLLTPPPPSPLSSLAQKNRCPAMCNYPWTPLHPRWRLVEPLTNETVATIAANLMLLCLFI